MSTHPFPYRAVHITLIALMVVLFILALALPAWAAQIGVASRLVFAVLSAVISVWLLRVRRSKVGAALVALVALGLLVTALLGYGFNGRPPL